MLEAALVRGLTEGGDRRRAGRHGPVADALFRDVTISTSTAASRSPAATTRPTTTASRCCCKGRSCSAQEIQELGQLRRRGRLERGRTAASRRSTSSTLMSIGCCRISRASAFRIGWDAGNGAAGPIARDARRAAARASITLFADVDGRFPNHHPDPTVEANLADLKRAGRRQAARFRHRLRRRRRPHRRGRRQGPHHLGRPAADDPRRAGAQGAARRDDHRRREGEPGAVRPRSPRSAASR